MDALQEEQDRQLALEPAFGRAAVRGAVIGFLVATTAFGLLGLVLGAGFGGAFGLGVFVGVWGGVGWGGMSGATLCFMRAEGHPVTVTASRVAAPTVDRARRAPRRGTPRHTASRA